MPSNPALGTSLRRLNYLGRLLSHHLGPFDLRQLELMFPLACIWQHRMCVPTTTALRGPGEKWPVSLLLRVPLPPVELGSRKGKVSCLSGMHRTLISPRSSGHTSKVYGFSLEQSLCRPQGPRHRTPTLDRIAYIFFMYLFPHSATPRATQPF